MSEKQIKKEAQENKEKNNRKIALMFHSLYKKIDEEIKDEKLNISLKKDIEKIQKEIKIKSLSDKEIEILKEFGFIQ